MPFGPYFAGLPLDSGGHHYVDQTSCDAWVDNEVNWKSNVNGGGFTLSNVTLVTTTTITSMSLLLTEAGQPNIAFQQTAGVATHKYANLIYDGGGAITGGGFVFQQMTDAGAFVGNRFALQISTGFIGIGGLLTPNAFIDFGAAAGNLLFYNSAVANNEFGLTVTSSGTELRTFAGGSTPIITFGRKTAGSFIEVFRIMTNATTTSSPLQASLPVYASDAAAGTGGLTSWQFYKHSDGSVYVKS